MHFTYCSRFFDCLEQAALFLQKDFARFLYSAKDSPFLGFMSSFTLDNWPKIDLFAITPEGLIASPACAKAGPNPNEAAATSVAATKDFTEKKRCKHWLAKSPASVNQEVEAETMENNS